MNTQRDRTMDLSEWEDRWQEGRIAFHQLHVHKMLESHLDKLLCGRKGIQIFVPLCGKAVDMKWLADMGHSVVGVEISEKGIKEFFEDQNLSYSEEPVGDIPEAKVYKSANGKISIYQCDLFKFSSAIAGKFGGIWDRGSLVAINPRDRERYASLMLSLMDKDCQYLIDTLQYNPELYKGPPFLVPHEEIKRLYGDACDIQLLDTVDAFAEKYKKWGVDYLIEEVYLLTPKVK